MLLFKEDELYYPDMIYDDKTTNTSFIHICGVLRSMGVKNYLFPLALFQPALQGVDPHSPLLTEEQKVMIGIECKFNPWYYMREIALVPPQAGIHPVKLRANRGNIAMLWCFFAHVNFILIQPRQTGKSLSVDELMVMLLFITMDNSRINMVTKDNTLRAANIERLKKIRDLLPEYLYIKHNRDKDNQEGLSCLAKGNSYVAGVSRSSEAGATNLGRGSTAPIAQVDEPPFQDHLDVMLPALLAAGTEARNEAKLNGLPSGTLLTTTAGKKNTKSGKYMFDLLSDACVWNESLYDSQNETDLHRTILANATGKMVIVNGTFSYKQLGKDDQWLYNALTEANSKGDDANRDFFNVWTAGSLRSPLTVKLNEIISNSDMEPLWTEKTAGGYLWRWYISKEEVDAGLKDGRYVLGNDTSDAIGRDAIALVLMDSRSMGVVGAAKISETNLLSFASWLSKFLVRFETVTYVVERKSSAQGILDVLIINLTQLGIDPFKRIYNVINDNRDDRKSDFQQIQRTGISSAHVYKKDFGFVTTGASRELLYGNVLQQVAKNAGHLVKDASLSSEIRALVIKNDRIDHVASGHDDLVISWLLCAWLLTSSKNLDFYGITSTHLLTHVVPAGEVAISPEEQYARDETRKNREYIRLLCQELGRTKDAYEVALLEAKLRVLADKTHSDEDDVALSIDELLSSAARIRGNKVKSSRNNRVSRYAHIRNRR